MLTGIWNKGVDDFLLPQGSGSQPEAVGLKRALFPDQSTLEATMGFVRPVVNLNATGQSADPGIETWFIVPEME